MLDLSVAPQSTDLSTRVSRSFRRVRSHILSKTVIVFALFSVLTFIFIFTCFVEFSKHTCFDVLMCVSQFIYIRDKNLKISFVGFIFNMFHGWCVVFFKVSCINCYEIYLYYCIQQNIISLNVLLLKLSKILKLSEAICSRYARYQIYIKIIRYCV